MYHQGQTVHARHVQTQQQCVCVFFTLTSTTSVRADAVRVYGLVNSHINQPQILCLYVGWRLSADTATTAVGLPCR